MSEENTKKRLGRGLAALIGDLDQISVTAEKPETVSSTRDQKLVPISLIRANANNPRRYFGENELADLADSIRAHGVVQPILVRPAAGQDLGGAQYEIIAGERRWRAAQKAGIHEVPVVIREVEDRQALELAIIENVQRSDLNSLEEANGYQQLIDEYDYSQNELAQVIGKSRSHVANTLRLLKLPAMVQELVADGSLSAGHARALVGTSNPESLAKQVLKDGLSVRQVEALAADQSSNKTVNGQSRPSLSEKKPADILALERRLEERLGLKIDLRHKEKEAGELRIKYRNLEQLDEVCRRLESGL